MQKWIKFHATRSTNKKVLNAQMNSILRIFLSLTSALEWKKAHSEVTKSWHMHLQVATNFFKLKFICQQKNSNYIPSHVNHKWKFFTSPDKINFFGRKFHQSQIATRNEEEEFE